MSNISVIVPVYNSGVILPELIVRLDKVLRTITESFDIILINDDSQDNSWNVISELARTHPAIHGINLMRNYGQHNALLCGIHHVKNDIIITMDDDLQHPPEEIPKLLAKLDEGYDVVYGFPEHEHHSVWRNVASQMTKIALQKAMGAKIARNISAFRAFRTQVCEAFKHYQGSFVSIDVLLTWGSTRFAALPVRHATRFRGVSNYTVRKLITHAFNMITGFYTFPLRVASFSGFVFMFFGMGILIFVLGRYLLEGGSVPGFPFLASIIAIFSGVQLFTLGIIGEYLARMHFRTMERPIYTIRSTTF